MEELRKNRSVSILPGITILFISAFPLARISIGPIPLYLVDILVFFLFVYYSNTRAVIPNRLSNLIFGFYFFVVIGELNGAINYGAILEPAYMMARYFLAVTVCFLIAKSVNNSEDLNMLLKFLTAGLLVTSVVTVFVSLPPTRGLALNTAFSIPVIAPDSSGIRKAMTLFGIMTLEIL